MTFDDYLLDVFYRIDSELEAMNLPRLRRRGPQPRLHDSEVITMEVAGEFLGIETDKGIWEHFRRYHLREFPMLARTDRTRFVRQAADLWRVKQLLHQRLIDRMPPQELALPPLWLFDSFPLRVCRFKRAKTSKLFRPLGAAFGYDPTGEMLFFGYRVHLRCNEQGLCLAMTLAPANVPDVQLVRELLPPRPRRGGDEIGIGDRGYWDPEFQESLIRDDALELHAPFRKKSSDPTPQRSALLARLRQIIEPVIGQLATHFHCQRTWARDLWHLCARLARKLLSHTIAVLLNAGQGHPPLQLDLLLDG
jgi:hypothetical protein